MNSTTIFRARKRMLNIKANFRNIDQDTTNKLYKKRNKTRNMFSKHVT